MGDRGGPNISEADRIFRKYMVRGTEYFRHIRSGRTGNRGDRLCRDRSNIHGSGPSAGPRRFQTLEAILLFYLGLSESDERKHWDRAMACCRIRYRCLRALPTATANLLRFHSRYGRFARSNAVAKRKVNTFTPCSQTRGKLHDSGTREHSTNRTPVSPIFSVHKMVADAPPDVTSPTFLTYFSLRASGPPCKLT